MWMTVFPFSVGAGTGGVREALSLAEIEFVRSDSRRSAGESWKSHVIWRRSQLLHCGPVSLHWYSCQEGTWSQEHMLMSTVSRTDLDAPNFALTAASLRFSM